MAKQGVSDRELLKRIAARDTTALAALHSHYYLRMSRFILQITRDLELSKEVINDVFLVVWQKAAEFRGESAVSTWILGIAYRKALKAVKQKRHWLPLDEEQIAADDALECASVGEQLQYALEQLSAAQKAVVELSYYFGYNYKEIADILECPENTVKTRMFHARRQLRSLLEHQ